MKQTIKRLMALLLAMAMSLSLLSANVWAAEEETELLEDGSISAQSSERIIEEDQQEDSEANDQSSEESSSEDISALKEDSSVHEGITQDEESSGENKTDGNNDEKRQEDEPISVSDESIDGEQEEVDSESSTSDNNQKQTQVLIPSDEDTEKQITDDSLPDQEILSPQSSSSAWVWPTSNHTIKSDWPCYSSGSYHGGTDFPVALNSPVYSTCTGDVVDIQSLTTSYGKHIKIRATVNGSTVYMRYCHLNGFNVSVGDHVRVGQQIGVSGSTGNSTGPHLHYEVRDSNDRYGSSSSPNLNPRNYLPGTSYTFEDDDPHAPFGYFDAAVGGEGTLYVRGWAADWDNPDAALAIHVYVGGEAGSGAPCYDGIVANKHRPDVNQEYPGIGEYHGFEETIQVGRLGNLPIYVYAINTGEGNNNPCIGMKEVTVVDTTAPTISDVKITNVTASSYTVTCKVADYFGVESVKFPTWSVKDGQDDLVWHVGTFSNGIASCTIKASDHKNETNSFYSTHIYAYDAAGNATGVEVNEIWMMSPSKTIPDGRYHIGSKMNNSTTVTVGGESKAEGGNINLWNSYDTANQCFDISYLNNGYYKIINTNSGMALTADNGALTDGNVIQHSYTGSDDQQWAILNVGDGIYFELVPRANFLVRLDAQGAVPDNGTNIVVHTKNNYKNQRWCFAPWIPSTNVDYINGIVTFAGKELTEGIDYACERIANGVSITVKIIGKKPYASGMVSETLTDPFVVMLSQNYYFFDGTPKEPFTLVYIEGRLLENRRDYDVSYSNNVACGEATATIQFKGQYQGYNSRYEHERRVGFRIDKMPVSQCHVALSQNCLFFDGSQKKPSVIINNGNKELILNTDYTVSYGENTSPGTGTVKITGKGNYQGETIVGFSIQPSNLDDCTIDLSEKSYFYDGNPKLPAVTLKNGETPLIKGRDYEVSYQNNIQAGTASVLVTGKGGYTGTRGATFVIMPNRITDYVISLSEKTFIYDGAAKVPEVTIGNEEKTLNKVLDYEVSYRNNVNAGTATAIVIGKGIYSGKVEIPFTISKASNALSASMSNDSLHEKETAQM